MRYRPNAKNFRDQLRDEWAGFINELALRKYKKIWAAGFVLLSLIFAIAAGVRIHPTLNEIPLVLLSGFIHSLRFLSIVFYFWFGVVAYMVYHHIFNWADARWLEIATRKKLADSVVNFWTYFYWVFAFLSAVFVFMALSAPLYFVIFILPHYDNVLDTALIDYWD